MAMEKETALSILKQENLATAEEIREAVAALRDDPEYEKWVTYGNLLLALAERQEAEAQEAGYQEVKDQEAEGQEVKDQEAEGQEVKDQEAEGQGFVPVDEEDDYDYELEDAPVDEGTLDGLDAVSDNYSYSAFITEPENEDLGVIISNTDVVDDKNVVLEAEKKDDYLALLFDAAKLKAQASLSTDKEFAELESIEKAFTFRNEVRTFFFTDFAHATIASQMDKPTSAEQVMGSPAQKEYLAKQAEKARDTFAQILEGGKKISVKVDSILSSVADTAVKAENLIRSWRRKAHSKSKDISLASRDLWTKLANKIQAKKNALEAKANYVSEHRYEILKNIKNSLKDNSAKIVTNLGANVGMGAWMTAAVASGGTVAPALIAYGAYHATSSWVWPIVKEYRRINRERKENGGEKLGRKATWKLAAKTATSGKNKKKYIISGAVNSALGVALMGWGSHIMSAAETAKTAADAVNGATTAAMSVAATRATVRVTKAGAATGAQLIDAAVNKDKNVAYAAIAGGLINYFALGNSVGTADHSEVLAEQNLSDVAAPSNPVVAPQDTVVIDQVEPEVVADENVEVTDEATTVDETVEAPEVRTFPREYSSDMGISEKQYNTLLRITEGNSSLDVMYNNLSDEVMEKNFPGMTREQVMQKFSRLFAFSRAAEKGSSTTLYARSYGEEFLTRKFGNLHLNLDEEHFDQLVEFAQENASAGRATLEEGLNNIFPEPLDQKTMDSLIILIAQSQLPRFGANQEEMEALLGLLACGKPIPEDKLAGVRNLLDNADQILNSGRESGNGNYMEHMDISNGCTNDDAQWHKGAARVARKTKAVSETVAQPEEAVVQNNVVPEQPAPKSEPLYIEGEVVAKVTIPPINLKEIEIVDLPKEPVAPAVEVPEEPAPAVRKMTTSKFSDFSTGEADKQEIVSAAKAKKLMERQRN